MLTTIGWVLLATSILVANLIWSKYNIEIGTKLSEDTLILTHVLFRHGHRTPDTTELYPKDPYINETYYPYGRGQLTKEGKQRMYNVGEALRQRYKKFFGDHYYPGIIDALTTDYQRTKVSLQLVLASLFVPSLDEQWKNDLHWQPIPYNYLPKTKDNILLSVICSHYLNLYNDVIKSKEIQAEFTKHKKDFQYISYHSGLNVTSFLEVYNLYFGLFTQDNLEFTLPQWTQSLWPEIITNLAIKEYFVSTATPEMRQIASGYLIKKIIEDTKERISGNDKNATKMYLYSAHENNIAEFLIALKIFEPHVPPYGSYVLIETHYINKIFGFKIYYENHEDIDDPVLLKLPSCNEFCPLEEFFDIVKELIPNNDVPC